MPKPRTVGQSRVAYMQEVLSRGYGGVLQLVNVLKRGVCMQTRERTTVVLLGHVQVGASSPVIDASIDISLNGSIPYAERSTIEFILGPSLCDVHAGLVRTVGSTCARDNICRFIRRWVSRVSICTEMGCQSASLSLI